MHRRLIAIAVLGAVAAATAGPALAGSVPSRRVTVGDNFFSPTRLTVNKGTRIVFRWPSDNGNAHDVEVTSAPRGATRFHSPVRTANYTYRRTLTRSGTYRIICTLHPTMMKLTVRVRSSG